MDSFESVNFSKDGKFVIIMPVVKAYPTTKDIPPKVLALLNHAKAIGPPPAEPARPHEADSILPEISNLLIAPSNAVRGVHVSMHIDGSQSGVSTSRTAENVLQVHMWSDTGPETLHPRSELRFELCSLPSGVGTQYSRSTLLPRLREGRIRMVIEASRQHWASLAGKKNAPILVERDLHATEYQVQGPANKLISYLRSLLN
ncbi:hypothetical protein P171DRAFT_251809 [Karstenula rhodostoma CBS 690.94]|uniref:Uncharacterized protein n=1 Tax=Karstenula rhodostoma CBS 690.94 TaxID=1392251 RepID=A0A9P4PKX6_9PLEO|nr:hypothetical protein P171DRAFT_251809 [Karstenula rhodostoma CBS 690.94]